MYYLAFAVFFALNFSLWFVLPSLALKGIVKPSRKRKDENLKLYLFLYGVLCLVYAVIYILFYHHFAIAINDIPLMNSDNSHIFTSEIGNLSLMVILFLIISLALSIFTFLLAKRAFRIKQNNIGYAVCLVTGFLNILTYWFSNLVLNLNLYAFELEHYLLNILLKIDYEVLLFVFPVLVFLNFAISFVEEK